MTGYSNDEIKFPYRLLLTAIVASLRKTFVD